jgi:hypothetical protein
LAGAIVLLSFATRRRAFRDEQCVAEAPESVSRKTRSEENQAALGKRTRQLIGNRRQEESFAVGDALNQNEYFNYLFSLAERDHRCYLNWNRFAINKQYKYRFIFSASNLRGWETRVAVESRRVKSDGDKTCKTIIGDLHTTRAFTSN